MDLHNIKQDDRSFWNSMLLDILHVETSFNTMTYVGQITANYRNKNK